MLGPTAEPQPEELAAHSTDPQLQMPTRPAGCLSRGPRRVARTVLRGPPAQQAPALPDSRLQWVRDVTFDEDRSQFRTWNAPQVMATRRNTAISLLRPTGATSIAAALRHHAIEPDQPGKLILTR